MAVPRKAMTEGIRTPLFPGTLNRRTFTIPQSRACVRCASQLPLHKGAGVLPHQCVWGVVLGKIGSDLIRLFEPPSPWRKALGTDCDRRESLEGATPVLRHYSALRAGFAGCALYTPAGVVVRNDICFCTFSRKKEKARVPENTGPKNSEI